jgi:hypothetical protein
MNAFKKQCIVLRRKGYSINEIMKATGRAKSSIHTHIKEIPLSNERMKQYREASGKWIRKFALARKGKSERSFHAFETWSTGTALLVAHLLFDGEIAKGKCVYNNRSKALIERVEKLMQERYDFEPKWHQNQITGVWRISYHNVALSAYLNKKSKELLRGIRKMPLNLKREFIRAFFDDEGCMDFRPKKNIRRIRGYQKDVRVLRIIRALLVDFDITANIVLPNEVVIVGKKNLMRFEREINFSTGIFMNGNRSNSRWKKNVEKKELLKQAIASFKS